MNAGNPSSSSITEPFESVEWNRVLSGLDTFEMEQGELLVRQGETGDKAFYLLEGSVRIFIDTHYGSVTLATRHAPCLIGEIAVFAGLPRTASAGAATAIKAYAINRALLLDIGRQNPDFMLSVIQRMGQQIDGVNKVISTYTGALAALEQRDLDPRFLEELTNPSPQVMEFAAAFKRFAMQIVERRRQHDELAAAATLQRSFLPPASNLINAASRLELAAIMRPAKEVGGDFYDYFMIDENHLAVIIGDVCGKGMPACIFMAVVITILRSEARQGRNAQETVARANALLCQDNATSMFATAFYLVLDLRNGTIDYCNCGHNPPMLWHRDGSVTMLAATGLPLGLFANRSAAMATIALPCDAVLLLYTDGVTEAANSRVEEFGEERLTEILSAAALRPAEEIIDSVLESVDLYSVGTEQSDDITCVTLRRKP